MHKRRNGFLGILAAVTLIATLCPMAAFAHHGAPATQLLASPSLETQAGSIASGTWGTCPWDISADGTLTVHAGTGPDTTELPWADHKASVKRVVFAAENGNKVKPLSCMYLLEDMVNVTSVDLSGLDTSLSTSMFDMFANCTSLQSIDLSGLNLSKVTNMSFMFAGCTSLKSVSLAGLAANSATNISYMFSGCSALQSVNFTSFSSPNLTGMEGLFEGCAALRTVDLSSLNTKKVTALAGLFSGCRALEYANLSGMQTSKATSMRYLFYECAKLRYVDLSSFDTSLVSDVTDMFKGCDALTAIDLGAKVTKLGALPSNLLNGSEKWYSAVDGKWYTVAEIFSQRLGIADSYTKFDAAGAVQYDLASAVVTPSPASFVYDGTEKKPGVTVELNDEEVPSWGYSLAYKNNVNAGTATVIVKGNGLYRGEASAPFAITKSGDSNNGEGNEGSGNGENGENGNSSGDGSGSGNAKSDIASYRGKAKAAGFTDLIDGEWYMKVPDGAFPNTSTLYLDYTIARGLMSGYSGTTLFGPNDQLDRGMAATIIYRMATGKTSESTNNDVSTRFSDVPSGQWYSAAVAWCAENGVITGYKDAAGNLTGRFGPGDSVTREQLTTMIARYCMKVKGMPSAGTDLSRFPDYASVSAYAVESVAFCVANGIVSGYSHNGHFAPQDGASRCQMSKIIAVTARMLE